jgi:hypothetical protein
MPEASSVTFDVLLGGKVTPQVLKAFKDLEDLIARQRKPSTPSCEGAYKKPSSLRQRESRQPSASLSLLAASDVGKVMKTIACR